VNINKGKVLKNGSKDPGGEGSRIGRSRPAKLSERPGEHPKNDGPRREFFAAEPPSLGRA